MSFKYSIVLIEDSREDTFLVREALNAAGFEYDLTVIEDGGTAVSFLKRAGEDRRNPDLFLVDLNLPKTSGIELIRLIQANAQCTSTPVIVMSSSDSPRDRQEAADSGVSHYFCKPLELDQFMQLGDMVRSLLKRREGVI